MTLEILVRLKLMLLSILKISQLRTCFKGPTPDSMPKRPPPDVAGAEASKGLQVDSEITP